MFISGIADEASPQLVRQIQAHEALGWKHIELRNVDGMNWTDLPQEAFDRYASELDAHGLQASCFASQIANWSRPIDGDLEKDVAELRRAIPRMQRLKAPFIRCMSYPNSKPPLPDPAWRGEVVRRLKILTQMAADAGITFVHENCNGWGGLGPEQTLDLLADIGSPFFRLVFDTGNPVPYGQDSWGYYQMVRDHVAYVHVKDYVLGPGGKEQAVFPGEGKGAVREIARDLLGRGYQGGFSIEPHITSVIHLGKTASDPELAYRTYVEYGRRFEKLLNEIRQ